LAEEVTQEVCTIEYVPEEVVAEATLVEVVGPLGHTIIIFC
jgi:hypothetical protein